MTAAIYARKATDQAGVADEQKSVARQVEHARADAARKGWTVNDARSGARFAVDFFAAFDLRRMGPTPNPIPGDAAPLQPVR